MSIYKKKITEIVSHNYVNASVLFYFGISFFEYSEKTLEQVCNEKGLDVDAVISRLESNPSHGREELAELQQYPIDLIVEYLKHTHFIFIKQRLPYIARLIEGTNSRGTHYSLIAKDLKFVFPLFVEDFIHHIYQEEDTLFSYIMVLHNYLNDRGNPSKVYWEMEQHSLQKYAMEHDEHDDEMQGIRKFTNHYFIDEHTPLHIKVIYEELKCLEEELITHARIENDILFPKALALEKEVGLKIQSKIKLN